jgi:hypothetical protein
VQKTSNFSQHVHRSTSFLIFFSDILALKMKPKSSPEISVPNQPPPSAAQRTKERGQRLVILIFTESNVLVSILYSCIFTRDVLETAPYIKMKCKQDRQCTHNVTLRRFRESLLPWKSNKYSLLACMWVPGRVGVCLHIHAYPACKVCAPYCDVICGPSASTKFWAGPLKRDGLKSCLARR